MSGKGKSSVKDGGSNKETKSGKSKKRSDGSSTKPKDSSTKGNSTKSQSTPDKKKSKEGGAKGKPGDGNSNKSGSSSKAGGGNKTPPGMRGETKTEMVVEDDANAVDYGPYSSPFFRLFCCFCLLPKRKRKAKRKLEKERLERLLSAPKPVVEELVEDEAAQLMNKKILAATKIQAIIRSRLACNLVKEAWILAIGEANEFWSYQIQLLEEARRRRELVARARKEFAETYVSDILGTSMHFHQQTSQASTEIQRIWRGYRDRSLHWSRLKRKKKINKFPPPKQPKKSRFSSEVLRRVWSRRAFQPQDGKWLHTTDFGQLDYDMWEHMDSPPAGNRHGLRTHKVKAPARSERSKEALVGDRHAWVGLPVGIESAAEKKLKQKEGEPENVVRLKSKSPYNAPVVNWDKLDAEAAEKERKIKKQRGHSSAVESRPTSATAVSANSAADGAEGKGSRSRRIVGDNASPVDIEEEEADDLELDSSSDSSSSSSEEAKDYRRERRKRQEEDAPSKQKSKKDKKTKHSGEQEEEEEEEEMSVVKEIRGVRRQPPPSRLTNSEILSELMRYGYDPSVLDPTISRGFVPIGTKSYDLTTGRRIIHKGRNRWVGVHDPSFEVQYEIPEAALRKDAEEEEQASLLAGSSLQADSFGEAPRMRQTKAGTVVYRNASLQNKNSQFLRDHKQLFIDNFTHHNLSDYSGLVHQHPETSITSTGDFKGLAPHPAAPAAATAADDDDVSEFNYYMPSSSHAQQQQRGFKDGLLAGAAASLGRTLQDNQHQIQHAAVGGLFTGMGRMVQYTPRGYPVRGARKPHAPNPFQIAEYHAQMEAGTFDINSYRGMPGSNNNNNNNSNSSSSQKLSSPARRQQQQPRGLQVSGYLGNINTHGGTDKGGAGVDGGASGGSSLSKVSSQWQSSAWGNLKGKVQEAAAAAASNPELQRKLYGAVTGTAAVGAAAAAASSLAASELTGGASTIALNLNSTASASTYSQQEEGDGNSNDPNYDSDEEMWRSRSVYRPKKEIVAKVVVWPKAPKQSYKLRYTWIPQPLVHNAVNNVYYDKTVRDYAREAKARNTSNFRQDVFQSKDRYQKRVEKDSLVSAVSVGGVEDGEQQQLLEDTGSVVQFLDAGRSHLRSSRDHDNVDDSDDGGGDLLLGERVHVPEEGEDGGGGSEASPNSSVASSKYYKHFIDADEESPSRQKGAGGGAGGGGGSQLSSPQRSQKSPASVSASKKNKSRAMRRVQSYGSQSSLDSLMETPGAASRGGGGGGEGGYEYESSDLEELSPSSQRKLSPATGATSSPPPQLLKSFSFSLRRQDSNRQRNSPISPQQQPLHPGGSSSGGGGDTAEYDVVIAAGGAGGATTSGTGSGLLSRQNSWVGSNSDGSRRLPRTGSLVSNMSKDDNVSALGEEVPFLASPSVSRQPSVEGGSGSSEGPGSFVDPLATTTTGSFYNVRAAGKKHQAGAGRKGSNKRQGDAKEEDEEDDEFKYAFHAVKTMEPKAVLLDVADVDARQLQSNHYLTVEQRQQLKQQQSALPQQPQQQPQYQRGQEWEDEEPRRIRGALGMPDPAGGSGDWYTSASHSAAAAAGVAPLPVSGAPVLTQRQVVIRPPPRDPPPPSAPTTAAAAAAAGAGRGAGRQQQQQPPPPSRNTTAATTATGPTNVAATGNSAASGYGPRFKFSAPPPASKPPKSNLTGEDTTSAEMLQKIMTSSSSFKLSHQSEKQQQKQHDRSTIAGMGGSRPTTADKEEEDRGGRSTPLKGDAKTLALAHSIDPALIPSNVGNGTGTGAGMLSRKESSRSRSGMSLKKSASGVSLSSIDEHHIVNNINTTTRAGSSVRRPQPPKSPPPGYTAQPQQSQSQSQSELQIQVPSLSRSSSRNRNSSSFQNTFSNEAEGADGNGPLSTTSSYSAASVAAAGAMSSPGSPSRKVSAPSSSTRTLISSSKQQQGLKRVDSIHDCDFR